MELSVIDKKYPVLHTDYSFHLSPEEIGIYNKASNKMIKISKDYWIIYKNFLGKKTVKEIFLELINIYNIDYKNYLNFITIALEKQYIMLLDEPYSFRIKTIGDENNYYPYNLSIELTEKCNLRCNYCYGMYEPSKFLEIPYSELEVALKYLASKGVPSIELTGGEPLMHKDFYKILKLSIESFDFVTILSNGVLFNKNILSLIRKNLKKVFIQISIEGSNETIFDKMRGIKGTFRKTWENILAINDLGIKYKLVYMLCDDNLDNLLNTCEMLNLYKIKNKLAISLISKIGRACDSTCEKQTKPKLINEKEFLRISKEINYKYLEIMIPKINYEGIEDVTNCGAGWKLAQLKADGSLVACTLLGIKSKLGSIYSDDITTIFNKHKKAKLFREVYLNRKEMNCRLCEYNDYCGICIARIYFANLERLKNKKELCNVVVKNKLYCIIDFKSNAYS